MEAKAILEAQKMASASAQLTASRVSTNALIGSAFDNGLFNAPVAQINRCGQQQTQGFSQCMPSYANQQQAAYHPQTGQLMQQNMYANQFQDNFQGNMGMQTQQPEFY